MGSHYHEDRKNPLIGVVFIVMLLILMLADKVLG